MSVYYKSETLAFKYYCLCYKLQNLILELKTEKGFAIVFGGLHLTNGPEAIKFFNSLWKRIKFRKLCK